MDHQLSWELTNLKRDGLVANPRWGIWRLAGAALEVAESAVEKQPADDRIAQLQAMRYREYLCTPEWRKTRAAAAVLRAGSRCALDVTHTEGLQVHHNNYDRLGAELANDLVVLCHACHLLHHKQYGRPRRAKLPETRSQASPTLSPVYTRPKTSLLRRLLAR